MFNLCLTAEQIEFRDTVRSFTESEIRPAAIHPDRLEPLEKPFMKNLLDQASELGLRTLMLSEDMGGVGADTLTSCIVFEELAAGDIDIAVALADTAQLGHHLFDNWMTPEQRERFLSSFLEDSTFHLAYAGPGVDDQTGWSYHEERPEDLNGAPVAVKKGNEWVIDGSVSYAANAPIAELIIVQARTDAGMTALLVPRDAPGLTIHKPEKALSETRIRWRHGCGSQIDFNECKVPAADMLGGEGKSPIAGSSYATASTLQLAAINLGLGRAAFNAAVDYAKMRRQGGRNIAEHQGIGKKIADMAIKLELAETIIFKAAWVADHPEAVADRSVSDLPLPAIASVYTADAINAVTLLAAECFGAMAVMRDMPLQRYVDDSFIFQHADTNDITTKLRIAEAVVDYRRSRAA